MAVFISVSTNSFQSTFEQQRRSTGSPKVRRPTTGLALKEETFAYLRAVRADGTPVKILDGGASPDSANEDGIGKSNGTTNFLLQQVSEQRMEKQQVVETFGEDFIFFFGEKPRFVSFGGLLLNTQNFNWKNEFQQNYENVFRGTKLLEADARAYMTYGDTMVEGYVVDSSVTLETGDPHAAQFSFQMFVTSHTIVGRASVGSIFIPTDPVVPETEGLSVEGATPPFAGSDTGATRLTQLRDRRAADEAKRLADQRANRSVPPKTYSEISEEYLVQGNRGDIYNQTGPDTGPGPTFGERAKKAFEEQFGVKMGYSGDSAQQVASKVISDLTTLGVKANSLKNQSLLTGPNAFNGITRLGTFGLGRASGELAKPFQNALGV